MKKITYLYLAVFSIFFIGNISAQTWNWLEQPKFVGHDCNAFTIATDPAGNSYFVGNSTLNVGFGDDTIKTVAYSQFVPKVDDDGNAVWAKRLQENFSKIERAGIATDANGNVYITSYFNTKFYYGGDSLVASGTGANMYLLKLDTDGNLLWMRSSTASGFSTGVDANGNVYVYGLCGSGTITFDTDSVITTDEHNYFLAKYNASGDIQWIKVMKNGRVLPPGLEYQPTNLLHVSANGDCYITGGLTFSVTLEGTTFNYFGTPSRHSQHIFTAKYDTDGNLLWAKQSGSPANSTNYRDNTYAITADNSGNCYISGVFHDSLYFGSQPVLVGTTDQYGSSMFIAKYDGTGNEVWSTMTDKDYYIISQSLATDNSGNIYVAGYADDSLVVGSSKLRSAGNEDAFIAKYDAMGNGLFAVLGGSTGSEWVADMSVNPTTGSINIIGKYDGAPGTTFTPHTLGGNTGSDRLIFAQLKDNSITTGINSFTSKALSAGKIYPNPSNGKNLRIENQENQTIAIIYNCKGEMLDRLNLQKGANSIDLNLAQGLYFIQVGEVIEKIMIIE